jgi:hypothetical protein
LRSVPGVELDGQGDGAADPEDRLARRGACETDVWHTAGHDDEGFGQVGLGQMGAEVVVDIRHLA